MTQVDDLTGTSCWRKTIAIGASIKVPGRDPAKKASFNSGKPEKRTGWKKLLPTMFWFIQSVTGQVRWQVTGRKPTRKLSVSNGSAEVEKPRLVKPTFNHTCSKPITATATTTDKVTRLRWDMSEFPFVKQSAPELSLEYNVNFDTEFLLNFV
jgi:hypothetical protein